MSSYVGSTRCQSQVETQLSAVQQLLFTPAVAALGHTQGRVPPHRGGYAQAKPPRNATPYA